MAEGKFFEVLPIMAGVPLVQVIKQFYNNSLEDIGNADSFVWYGPRRPLSQQHLAADTRLRLPKAVYDVLALFAIHLSLYLMVRYPMNL